MHIPERERCNWLRDNIETQRPGKYGPSRKAVILDRLMWATDFENFLSQKWTAAKRFGLEGCETLIPGMSRFFDFLFCVTSSPGIDLKIVGFVFVVSFKNQGSDYQWIILIQFLK